MKRIQLAIFGTGGFYKKGKEMEGYVHPAVVADL